MIPFPGQGGRTAAGGGRPLCADAPAVAAGGKRASLAVLAGRAMRPCSGWGAAAPPTTPTKRRFHGCRPPQWKRRRGVGAAEHNLARAAGSQASCRRRWRLVAPRGRDKPPRHPTAVVAAAWLAWQRPRLPSCRARGSRRFAGGGVHAAAVVGTAPNGRAGPPCQPEVGVRSSCGQRVAVGGSSPLWVTTDGSDRPKSSACLPSPSHPRVQYPQGRWHTFT